MKFYHPGAISAKFYKINVSACTLFPPHVITYLPELMWNRINCVQHYCLYMISANLEFKFKFFGSSGEE